jgi:hypothetical protein
MFHRQPGRRQAGNENRPGDCFKCNRRGRLIKIATGDRLLLPGALLVTMQTQLLAAFVLVNLCLAAFFQ